MFVIHGNTQDTPLSTAIQAESMDRLVWDQVDTDWRTLCFCYQRTQTQAYNTKPPTHMLTSEIVRARPLRILAASAVAAS